MRSVADRTDLGLIDWPALNPGADPEFGVRPWRDSGEGGLFVYAVWPHPEQADRCVVEHIVTLQEWDVAVGAHGPLAKELEARTGDAYGSAEAEVAMYGAGPVAYLGSTPHSLWFETTHDSGYFEVSGHEQLTEAGRALVGAMESVYGPATYLTLLDT